LYVPVRLVSAYIHSDHYQQGKFNIKPADLTYVIDLCSNSSLYPQISGRILLRPLIPGAGIHFMPLADRLIRP